MNHTVLRSELLSKEYRLGARRERYRTARETVAAAITAPYDWFRRDTRRNGRGETIWALKDITFDVSQGEVVGVIGRNGAGKSTLLKVLSRITEPTSGFAEVVGRVASLLEVGTGFHLELTGRENVFLNAAILGMTRQEVHRKFDEIVAFAEVERFIDTPVKHYSSGMHLRLAFSVAAHLEPEILLIDEVLAVGDAGFQKKCLGKMEDVASHGRTVLFVSHNLGVVRELCHSSVVLEGGNLAFRGPVIDGLAHYSEVLKRAPAIDAGATASWRSIHINDSPVSAAVSLAGGDPVAVSGHLDLRERLEAATLICLIEDSVGNTIVHHRAVSPDGWECPIEPGRFQVTVALPPLWLSPGAYTAYFKFMAHRESGVIDRAVSERVLLDVVGSRAGTGKAVLAPRSTWRIRPSGVADFEHTEQMACRR